MHDRFTNTARNQEEETAALVFTVNNKQKSTICTVPPSTFPPQIAVISVVGDVITVSHEKDHP